MLTFAEQLHEVRRERGVTQDQLAKEVNVSRQTISHWENGRAVPDIDTIKRISQVLNYNFLAVEGLAEGKQTGVSDAEMNAQPGEEEVHAAPVQQIKPALMKRRFLLPVALSCAFLCVVLAACLLMNRKPAEEPEPLYEPYSQEWYCQEQTPVAGQAFVSITPTENPVRLILFEDFPDGKGWFYTFEMKSHTDIDFTVNEIIVTSFRSDGTEDPDILTGDVLTGLYGSNVIDRRQVFHWMGGFPEQPIDAVGLLLKGVDAKGNELEFHGYAELSKELAE